jgi:hypothetical protein
MQTLVIHILGFNHNVYTFSSILLINIVLCGEFPWTKFINHKCFDMRMELSGISTSCEYNTAVAEFLAMSRLSIGRAGRHLCYRGTSLIKKSPPPP